MAVTAEALLDAIETSFFLMPEVPGRVEDIRIPGLLGRITPASHPLANAVGAARLDTATADATIARVRDRFAPQRKAFGWLVGPTTTPTDLPQRLRNAGLVKVEEMAGMALEDLELPIRADPTVRIREGTPDDMALACAMIARAYGMPGEVASLIGEALSSPQAKGRVRTYFAELDGEGPVAFGFLAPIPGQPIVRLSGAATLPEHRGKGIYTSLLARRLDDARRGGAEAAVIQAVRSTSAPICRKLGFEERCGLDFYAWLPSATDGPGASA